MKKIIAFVLASLFVLASYAANAADDFFTVTFTNNSGKPIYYLLWKMKNGVKSCEEEHCINPGKQKKHTYKKYSCLLQGRYSISSQLAIVQKFPDRYGKPYVDLLLERPSFNVSTDGNKNLIFEPSGGGAYLTSDSPSVYRNTYLVGF